MTRIGGIRMADATRAEFDDSTSANDLRELAKRPRVRVLQCSTPVRDAVWSLINEHFCPVRPDVELRVYGHYSSECDLRFVRLQSLPHVESFPGLTDSMALRRIVVENLKGLRNFTALETAPVLEEFALLEGRTQTPQQLLPVLANPRVRRISALFGSDRRNSEFSHLREECGKADFDIWEPFKYQ